MTEININNWYPTICQIDIDDISLQIITINIIYFLRNH